MGRRKRKLTPARKKRIETAARARQEGIIVLEDIHDPHNAEAVFRTCDGLGFGRIALIFEKEKRFNPRRVGRVTSASANKWLEYSLYDSAKKCFKDLKEKGYTVIGTACPPIGVDPDKTAAALSDVDFRRKKIALVFGNEHRGLSDEALRLCDELLYIPMRGMVQSLNLSVTAAVCMWEISRQRNYSKKFLLPKRERAKLIKSWSK